MENTEETLTLSMPIFLVAGLPALFKSLSSAAATRISAIIYMEIIRSSAAVL